MLGAEASIQHSVRALSVKEEHLSRKSQDVAITAGLLPPERLWKRDLVLGTLLNRAWQKRRVVYTKTDIFFVLVGDDSVRDRIPMEEVSDVEMMRDADDLDNIRNSLQSPLRHDGHGLRRRSETSTNFMYLNVFQIRTIPNGFNSGRAYYLQAESREYCETIVRDLQHYVRLAKTLAAGVSRFRMVQDSTRSVFKSTPIQLLSSCLIVADVLYNVDIFFIVVFTIELGINAFANWFTPFVKNRWSMMDLVIVILSLVCLAPVGLPLGLVLLLRSCRVLRIFGKVEAVSKIFAALSYSIVPLANAFFIIFVISSIYSIIGVTFFYDDSPDEFLTFARAFIAMFRITMGSVEWWFLNFPVVHEDGRINFWPSFFFVTYVVIINWIFFQVSIAVLLDNFLTASNAIKARQTLKQIQDKQLERQMKSPLDPLLLRLSKDYMNDADLSARLLELFKVLDCDGSGGLSSYEFQAAMKKLDVSPTIFLSDSDFIAITENGTLCNERGHLGPKEFENVMRKQIRSYTQSRLSSTSEYWNTSDEDFTPIATLKQILNEQLRMKGDQKASRKEFTELLQELRTDQEATKRDVGRILACLLPLDSQAAEIKPVISTIKEEQKHEVDSELTAYGCYLGDGSSPVETSAAPRKTDNRIILAAMDPDYLSQVSVQSSGEDERHMNGDKEVIPDTEAILVDKSMESADVPTMNGLHDPTKHVGGDAATAHGIPSIGALSSVTLQTNASSADIVDFATRDEGPAGVGPPGGPGGRRCEQCGALLGAVRPPKSRQRQRGAHWRRRRQSIAQVSRQGQPTPVATDSDDPDQTPTFRIHSDLIVPSRGRFNLFKESETDSGGGSLEEGCDWLDGWLRRLPIGRQSQAQGGLKGTPQGAARPPWFLAELRLPRRRGRKRRRGLVDEVPGD